MLRGLEALPVRVAGLIRPSRRNRGPGPRTAPAPPAGAGYSVGAVGTPAKRSPIQLMTSGAMVEDSWM